MTDCFRAILLSKDGDGHSVEIADLTDDDLMDGDVTVRVEHSTVNYKDGLAVTGAFPVVRVWPMIPGIDLAGTVTLSDTPAFSPGDRVLVNGWGMGEAHHGGYAEKARVPADWLVPVPENMTTSQAMAVGTAGYTAMLCIMALERAGIDPAKGDIIVTGAAGGVGSVAIALLAGLGYRVVASTGRAEEADYLKDLGASEVIDRSELSEPGPPMGSERWAGGIDAVGSHTLANVLAQIKYGGAVAACGLAQGVDLPATVMPLILRGVTLMGIDSVMAPKERREEAWRRIGKQLDLEKLDAMTSHIPLDDVPDAAGKILAGQVRGRLVVDL